MVCPGCGNLISTEETTCPMCGAKHPNLFGVGPYLNKLFGQQIDILSLIPTACIAIYVLSLVLDLGSALTPRGGIFGMLSPGGRPLEVLGITAGHKPWWTTLTAIYLHGGLLHILFNFIWIRQLGPEVGHLYGPARFFIIFTVGGAFGFVLSNTLTGVPTVGASGSIFGLLAALIVYGRNHRGAVADMLTRQLWQWAIMMFILGFMMSGVNNIAHLGGFIGGWVAAQVLVRGAAYQETRTVTLVALLALALTIGAFVMSILTYWPVLFML